MAVDTARLVRVHNKMRDARAKLAADFKVADDLLKDQMKMVEGAMLSFLNDNGMKTASTANGLFYWQEKITPRADDWERFYAFVKTEDAFDALERRIKTTFIKEYMEAHDGDVPPGVSVLREREIRVRKDNK